MDADFFEFTRLEAGQKLRTTALSKAMQTPDITDEVWLFVSPHDDDACLGAGLWIQAAIQAGVTVYLLIVTDGRMGYCQPNELEKIIETRRVETYDSCERLGLDQRFIRYIDYPDGALYVLQGRRTPTPDIDPIRGYIGLQNAMTYYLRDLRPTRVFVPTAADLHPDHRITHSELMISLFHAYGGIWPELGKPINAIPTVYEWAVYCDFPSDPNLQVWADEKAFSRKMESMAAFRSQTQIAQLLDNMRQGGPYEYLRKVDFRLYQPTTYRHLFA